MHLNHVGSNATKCKRSSYTLVYHTLTDILNSSQRCATRTCLDRETLTEVATGKNNLGSLLGKQYIARVLCIAYSTRGYLRRVAYRVNLNYEVDIMLRYSVRCVRIRHEVVSQYHHLICITCVRQSISQRATYTLGILRTRIATSIAQCIARRRAKESYINMQLA